VPVKVTAELPTREKAKYGKRVFAEHVVKAGVNTIDFSGFAPLLERIEKVLHHYKAPVHGYCVTILQSIRQGCEP